MLPDKTTRCHRTGFQETCFRCVTEHGCRLWKRLSVDADRASGQTHIEVYDCVDRLHHTYMMNLIGRQDTTTATVDKLTKEVREANDAGMASALMGLNAQVRNLESARLGQIENGAVTQKLIEAN